MPTKTAILAAILVLFCFSAIVYAQQSTFTKVYYDNSGSAQGYALVKSFDQNYLVAGEKDMRALVMKVDPAGSVLWSRKIGSYDGIRFNCISATHDSCFLLAGSIYDTVHGGNDLLCVKITSTGDTVWTKKLDFSTSAIPLDVQETNDHGFILTGVLSQVVVPYGKMLVIKLNSAGSVEWSHVFSYWSECRGYAVSQSGDGGFVVTGVMRNSLPLESAAFLMKLSPSGTVTWTNKLFGVPTDRFTGFDVAVKPDGYLCYIGYNGANAGIMLVKTGFSGFPEWNQTYEMFVPDIYNDNPGPKLRQTHDGGYIFSIPPDYSFAPVIKVDAAAHFQWGHTVAMIASDVVETGDSGYLVLGNGPIMGVKLAPNDHPQIGLIKTDASGNSSGCVMPGWFTSGNITVNSSSTAINVTAEGIAGQSHPAMSDAGLSIFDGCVTFLGKVPEKREEGTTIRIVPNPSDGRARVMIDHLGDPSGRNVEIFDVMGKKVYGAFQITTNDWPVDLGQHPDGVYFVRVQAGTNWYTQKMLLSRQQ